MQRVPDELDLLLHVVDPVSGTLARSFFPMPVTDPGLKAVATAAGFVDVDTKGDTLAIVFATTDSVFLFTRDGNRLESLQVPSIRMRRLLAAPDFKRESFRDVLESYSMVIRVAWRMDGLLVEYEDVHARQQVHGWVFFRSNSPTWETYPAPPLVMLRAEGVMFVDTSSTTPNRFLEGTWK